MKLSEAVLLPIADTSEQPLSAIFAEEPVNLTSFVTGKRFLNNPPLGALQYDVVRHLEQILYPETYELMVKEFGPYWEPVRFCNFFWLQIGKGGGKDHVIRIAALRIAYLLLCLKSPQEYYGMPAQDSIHILNVASSSSQANRAFFQPMKRAVERHENWFLNKSQPSQFSIIYDKNIEAISGHSDADSQEGLNIILGIADEISAFKTTDEIQLARGKSIREPSTSSEGVLKMLRTSARTRFPKSFKNVAISYPRFKGDAIQQLTIKGKEDNKKRGTTSRTYVLGPLSTWEFNPRIKGQEDFQEDYDENPVMARAMYECKPELSVNRYFRNDTAVYAAFNEIRSREPVEFSYEWKVAERDRMLMEAVPDDVEIALVKPAWQVAFDIDRDLRPIAGASYALHGDIGLTGDRAGIAMAHVRKQEERVWMGYAEDGANVPVTEVRPVVKLDFAASFSADATTQPMPREVQIRWYRELAWELIRRGFNIRRYTYDNFQSTDAMQILKSRGIESERVSTDLKPEIVTQLRDVIYDGRLEAYYSEIAVLEILALHRKSNGKIDHPPYGSKDIADSIAGAVHGAILLGGTEGDDPEQAFLGSALPESFAPIDFSLEELSTISLWPTR